MLKHDENTVQRNASNDYELVSLQSKRCKKGALADDGQR
jgi:hypothetical protein